MPMILIGFLSERSLAASRACEAIFRADTLRSVPVSEAGLAIKGTGFVIPNEKNTGDLKAHFKGVRKASGLYVTVGTERAFVAAGLLGSKITGLVLVDVDPRVNHFNLVNKALLAVAKDLSEYRYLRLSAAFDGVAMRIRADKNLSAENREILSNSALWSWWSKTVRNESFGWTQFYSDNANDTNYLFSETSFKNLQTLARANRIFVRHHSFTSPEFIDRLTNLAGELRTHISVIDLSNAWQYVSYDSTLDFLTQMRPRFASPTHLLVTYQKSTDPQKESEFFYSSKVLSANPDEVSTWQKEVSDLFSTMSRFEPGREPYRPSMRRGRELE